MFSCGGGSRDATTYGMSVTNQLVSTVAARGITIVSGLALGVDALAHQSALDVGARTIAVLPCGLRDYWYPKTNERLAQQIIDSGGLLVSEYEGEN